jgi:hypothetical protein
MKSNKIFFYLILSLFVYSCGTKSKSSSQSTVIPGLPDTLKLGISTTEEAQKELGTPTTTYQETNATKTPTEVLTYNKVGALQFENNIAKGFFREPKNEEIHLQYWLQKWAKKKTKTEKIDSSVNTHGQYEYQMINLEEKETIIYDNENGTVKRVMHYE